jgi:hypothetical protein
MDEIRRPADDSDTTFVGNKKAIQLGLRLGEDFLAWGGRAEVDADSDVVVVHTGMEMDLRDVPGRLGVVLVEERP